MLPTRLRTLNTIVWKSTRTQHNNTRSINIKKKKSTINKLKHWNNWREVITSNLPSSKGYNIAFKVCNAYSTWCVHCHLYRVPPCVNRSQFMDIIIEIYKLSTVLSKTPKEDKELAD